MKWALLVIPLLVADVANGFGSGSLMQHLFTDSVDTPACGEVFASNTTVTVANEPANPHTNLELNTTGIGWTMNLFTRIGTNLLSNYVPFGMYRVEVSNSLGLPIVGLVLSATVNGVADNLFTDKTEDGNDNLYASIFSNTKIVTGNKGSNCVVHNLQGEASSHTALSSYAGTTLSTKTGAFFQAPCYTKPSTEVPNPSIEICAQLIVQHQYKNTNQYYVICNTYPQLSKCSGISNCPTSTTGSTCYADTCSESFGTCLTGATALLEGTRCGSCSGGSCAAEGHCQIYECAKEEDSTKLQTQWGGHFNRYRLTNGETYCQADIVCAVGHVCTSPGVPEGTGWCTQQGQCINACHNFAHSSQCGSTQFTTQVGATQDYCCAEPICTPSDSGPQCSFVPANGIKCFKFDSPGKKAMRILDGEMIPQSASCGYCENFVCVINDPADGSVSSGGQCANDLHCEQGDDSCVYYTCDSGVCTKHLTCNQPTNGLCDPGTGTCSCNTGFYGSRCENNTDPCSNAPNCIGCNPVLNTVTKLADYTCSRCTTGYLLGIAQRCDVQVSRFNLNCSATAVSDTTIYVKFNVPIRPQGATVGSSCDNLVNTDNGRFGDTCTIVALNATDGSFIVTHNAKKDFTNFSIPLSSLIGTFEVAPEESTVFDENVACQIRRGCTDCAPLVHLWYPSQVCDISSSLGADSFETLTNTPNWDFTVSSAATVQSTITYNSFFQQASSQLCETSGEEHSGGTVVSSPPCNKYTPLPTGVAHELAEHAGTETLAFQNQENCGEIGLTYLDSDFFGVTPNTFTLASTDRKHPLLYSPPSYSPFAAQNQQELVYQYSYAANPVNLVTWTRWKDYSTVFQRMTPKVVTVNRGDRTRITAQFALQDCSSGTVTTDLTDLIKQDKIAYTWFYTVDGCDVEQQYNSNCDCSCLPGKTWNHESHNGGTKTPSQTPSLTHQQNTSRKCFPDVLQLSQFSPQDITDLSVPESGVFSLDINTANLPTAFSLKSTIRFQLYFTYCPEGCSTKIANKPICQNLRKVSSSDCGTSSPASDKIVIQDGARKEVAQHWGWGFWNFRNFHFNSRAFCDPEASVCFEGNITDYYNWDIQVNTLPPQTAVPEGKFMTMGTVNDSLIIDCASATKDVTPVRHDNSLDSVPLTYTWTICKYCPTTGQCINDCNSELFKCGGGEDQAAAGVFNLTGYYWRPVPVGTYQITCQARRVGTLYPQCNSYTTTVTVAQLPAGLGSATHLDVHLSKNSTNETLSMNFVCTLANQDVIQPTTIKFDWWVNGAVAVQNTMAGSYQVSADKYNNTVTVGCRVSVTVSSGANYSQYTEISTEPNFAPVGGKIIVLIDPDINNQILDDRFSADHPGASNKVAVQEHFVNETNGWAYHFGSLPNNTAKSVDKWWYRIPIVDVNDPAYRKVNYTSYRVYALDFVACVTDRIKYEYEIAFLNNVPAPFVFAVYDDSCFGLECTNVVQWSPPPIYTFASSQTNIGVYAVSPDNTTSHVQTRVGWQFGSDTAQNAIGTASPSFLDIVNGIGSTWGVSGAFPDPPTLDDTTGNGVLLEYHTKLYADMLKGYAGKLGVQAAIVIGARVHPDNVTGAVSSIDGKTYKSDDLTQQMWNAVTDLYQFNKLLAGIRYGRDIYNLVRTLDTAHTVYGVEQARAKQSTALLPEINIITGHGLQLQWAIGNLTQAINASGVNEAAQDDIAHLQGLLIQVLVSGGTLTVAQELRINQAIIATVVAGQSPDTSYAQPADSDGSIYYIHKTISNPGGPVDITVQCLAPACVPSVAFPDGGGPIFTILDYTVPAGITAVEVLIISNANNKRIASATQGLGGTGYDLYIIDRDNGQTLVYDGKTPETTLNAFITIPFPKGYVNPTCFDAMPTTTDATGAYTKDTDATTGPPVVVGYSITCPINSISTDNSFSAANATSKIHTLSVLGGVATPFGTQNNPPPMTPAQPLAPSRPQAPPPPNAARSPTILQQALLANTQGSSSHVNKANLGIGIGVGVGVPLLLLILLLLIFLLLRNRPKKQASQEYYLKYNPYMVPGAEPVYYAPGMYAPPPPSPNAHMYGGYVYS